MFRKLIMTASTLGAIAVIPLLSNPTTVRADDWEDYWEDYEDAREDYWKSVRKMERRPMDDWEDYWEDHRDWDRKRSRYYYYRPYGETYYYTPPYSNSRYYYYYGPRAYGQIGPIQYEYWR
ncbi:MAG TPA: hypothetical protein VLA12_07040 [Planctomycetaceae bacterium]|nr:hypothetical protein [Planctomycetaceae bacterium]